jgi:hypothetical protein
MSATDDAIADGQIEIWKKIVDVQQHFNDLELRIRNFALAVTGAFLGLGGYAIKDGGFTSLLGLHVSVAGIVVFAAIFPLAAFYFMDRLWYHRLLEGSVAAGIKAESSLQSIGFSCELGSEIKAASPFEMWFFGWRRVRSKHKMDLFYVVLFLSLLLVAGVLGFGLPNDKESVAHALPQTQLPASTVQRPAQSASIPAEKSAQDHSTHPDS